MLLRVALIKEILWAKCGVVLAEIPFALADAMMLWDTTTRLVHTT
jgi:hypothetical protein